MLVMNFSNKKKYAIIIFFIVIFCSIEVLSRLIISNDWVLNTTSPFSDTVWRLRWENHYKKTQVISNKIDTYNPILGWSPLKNSTNLYYDNKSIVSFNCDGIRGQINYDLNKKENTFRIAAVGDSFTFGEGVNDDETYLAQLEKILPKTEILNFAVHGYGTDQMLLRLGSDVFNYHPDIVIYAFMDDDLARAVVNFRDYFKPRFELVNGALKLKNTPIIDPKDYIKNIKYKTAIPDMTQLLIDRLTINEDKLTPRIEQINKAIWTQAANDIKSHQSIPIFLYLPAGDGMYAPLSTKLYSEDLMFSFCKEMDIACFSARPYLLEAEKNGVEFKTDIHYEPYTHKIIADGLAKDLEPILQNIP